MRLRNALIPIVTVIGLQVGMLFTGAILTETIFSWPGVGHWLIEGDRPARLSGAAGRHAADRRHHHDGQSAGRRHLRRDQSAHPAQPMSSADLSKRRSSPRGHARRRTRCANSGGFFPQPRRRRRPRSSSARSVHRRDGQHHRALFADPHQRQRASSNRRSGRPAAASPIRSAPTRSAATCFRASSTARGCRC